MDFRKVIATSPNHDARPDGVAIDMLVLHYTGMKTADEALSRLCDPAAEVSAHYTIDRKGCVYVHVDEARRAWHAGRSFWDGSAHVNARSIGIELINPGHEFGYVAFPEDQIVSLMVLAKDILGRHAIPASHIVGHSDVAPMRKADPGELFPWPRLAANGIGLFPSQADLAAVPAGDAALHARLQAYGYGLPPACDASEEAVITAFQRHFRPRAITGFWDDECDRLLHALLHMKI